MPRESGRTATSRHGARRRTRTSICPRENENFALETQDQDVQDFLARRKRKQMRRKMLAGIAWAGGICLLLLVAALVWRIMS